MSRIPARNELAKDIFLIAIGITIAVVATREGLLDGFLGLFGNDALASFVSGVFFTSVFTIAPAAVALTHIMETAPVGTVAFWGALGSLCGDMILFFFIRDKFSEDLRRSFKPSFVKHLFASFHFGFLKWLSPILGALIIASPLPDELGLALMGLSKTRVAVIIPVSFAMNWLGIYTIVWFARLM